MKKIFLIFLILVVISGCIKEESQITTSGKAIAEDTAPSMQKLKILHIMSYHSPWEWTDSQLNGFKTALNGLNIEYNVFQMDTKRKSSNEWKEEVGKEARVLIDSWQPDLVYTNDDNAQEYVVKYYVNTSIPFIFSAVNADPSKYGFIGSANIAGVLEQEHFVETVKLLKKISPGIKKIAVIFDDDLTWPGVTNRMREKLDQLPDVEFISWDIIYTFEEYKKRIKELQTEADAIALLGIFTFKDENGENVLYQNVLKWTAENSNLPDFSFWEDRISYGTLCAVTESGYEQGLAAGKIAREVLVNGRSPSSFEFKPTVKGEPVINLARANKLGLKITSDILLGAKVIEKFEWED